MKHKGLQQEDSYEENLIPSNTPSATTFIVRLLVLILTIGSFFGILLFLVLVQPDSDNSSTQTLSIILAADSATGEIAPILSLTTNQVNETTIYCTSITSGLFYGQNILAVVTGIGNFYVTVCVQELLNNYGTQIKEMIYCGTAGGSASLGGYLTSTGDLHNTPAMMIGDVCISSAARSYDDHWSSVEDWATSGTPWTPGYGWMAFTNPKYGTGGIFTQPTLVDSLMNVAKNITFPTLPEAIVNYSLLFHSPNEIRSPQVFDYSVCSENSGNDYWSGIPEDAICRNFTAALLNNANFNPKNLSDDQVLCITAMEAYGFIQTVEIWRSKQLNPITIDLAVLRGMSDYTHPPVIQNETDGKYYQIMPTYEWRDIGYNFGGYSFAIQTATLPIMKLFELRSLNL